MTVKEKYVLDVCCGSRMFYFDKNSKDVLFCDNRHLSETLCDGRKLEIHPDMIADFRGLPFDGNSFNLVIFDPPHLNKIGSSSWLAKKYGSLPEQNWKEYLGQGFSECWRVLANHGTLVFKWNENQIKLSELEPLFPCTPLFGDRSKGVHTFFLVFFKNQA